jgi:actin
MDLKETFHFLFCFHPLKRTNSAGFLNVLNKKEKGDRKSKRKKVIITQHTTEMDATLIVDYGQHTVKHGVLQHKRPSAGKKQQAAAQHQTSSSSDQTVFTSPSRDTNCKFNMNVSAVAGHVAAIAADAGLTGGTNFGLSFLTHPLLATPAKELLLQCLFEDIKPQRVFLGYSAVCALFSSGATSSLVLDIGHFRTTVIPVSRGVPITHLTTTTHLGGAAVDSALVSLLRQQHHVPDELLSSDLLRSIKALNCYVPFHHSHSPHPATAPPTAAPKPLVVPLPDGQTMRIPLTELDYASVGGALFEPAPGSFEPNPLHVAVDCARATFLENEDVCRSYLVTGGPSMMRGACEAAGHALAPSSLPIHISAGGAFLQRRLLKDRDTGSWAGACILSHLGSFPHMCIDAGMYAEEGPRRCLKIRAVDSR